MTGEELAPKAVALLKSLVSNLHLVLDTTNGGSDSLQTAW